jgi:hypothetical protein
VKNRIKYNDVKLVNLYGMDGEGMYFLDYDNKSIVEVGNDFKELQQRFKILPPS